MHINKSFFILLFCTLMYALTLTFSGIKIFQDIQERSRKGEAEFLDLAARTSGAAVYGFLSEPFQETIRDFLASSQILKAVLITGPNGVEFAYEKERGYIDWTAGPVFAPSFPLVLPPLSAPLRVEGIRNVVLLAQGEYLDRSFISQILLLSLIVITAALLLAIVSYILEKNLSLAQETESHNFSPEQEGAPPVVSSPEESLSSPITSSDPEDLFEIPRLDLSEEDISATEKEDTPHSPVHKAQETEPLLYTPHTGVSWESHLEERLTAELHRSASFDQDLALLIIEAPEVQEEELPLLAEKIVGFFTFRDMVFEWGTQGFSVILPNIDLDHAFKMADEFHTKLYKDPDTRHIRIAIGITSRSGRLVEASRLRREAEEALRKAKQEEIHPIVAFKSDPDKYRAYLKKQEEP
ncbi:MAG: hypothetical protein N2Z76_04890 [Treponemataceae bacterium]|nr:hypothetical protein [Treponemataceae bacterium]